MLLKYVALAVATVAASSTQFPPVAWAVGAVAPVLPS